MLFSLRQAREMGKRQASTESSGSSESDSTVRFVRQKFRPTDRSISVDNDRDEIRQNLNQAENSITAVYHSAVKKKIMPRQSTIHKWDTKTEE